MLEWRIKGFIGCILVDFWFNDQPKRLAGVSRLTAYRRMGGFFACL